MKFTQEYDRMGHGGSLEFLREFFQSLLWGLGNGRAERKESLAQGGGGQEPGEHISQHFIHECSSNRTRWGGFINVKPAVIIRNFLISGFGVYISATYEHQTGELSISRLSSLFY